jgi:alkylation response protein AidB-like acyl-CoA dehydrogenase
MIFELNEEQQTFADSVRRFAEANLKAGALERAHDPHFPRDVAQMLAKQGLMGIAFDPELMVARAVRCSTR